MKQWNTPGGTAQNLCLDMLKQPHILVAGSTGSGKSTLIESLIYTALYRAPCDLQLVLIDPKSVQLKRFAKLPHTLAHARAPEECARTLHQCAELMEQRFAKMDMLDQTQSTDPDIYIIIDEWVDIKLMAGSTAEADTIRIASKGRAANMHLVLCTQRPTRDIITGAIRANFSSKVGLRTESKQESRNIFDLPCCESLPLYGYGYYKTPAYKTPQLCRIEKTPGETLDERVKWWTSQI